jgi:hypothetical protein
MEDVARETDHQVELYYHVSGRRLLARALERAFKSLLAVLDEPGARSGTPLERLRHIVYQSVIITLEFVQEVELLQRVKGNTPTERQAMARRRRFDREVAALVRHAGAAGQIDAHVDAALLTRLIFAETMTRLVFEGIVRDAQG